MDVAESSPEIMGGTLVFKGTRVPVRTLFDYLEADDTAGDFLGNFPSVSKAPVTAAAGSTRDRLMIRSGEVSVISTGRPTNPD